MGNQHDSAGNLEPPSNKHKYNVTVDTCTPVSSISSYQSCSASPSIHSANTPSTAKPRVSIKSFIHQNLAMNNGITGKYISQRLVSIAAAFWITHIDSLSEHDKLELACSLFFGMISSKNKDMKDITKTLLSSNHNIETHSLKHLDMIGYLIRSLLRDGIDLHSMLQNIGALHRKIGIKMHHFDIMIQSLHETMSYYFSKHYNIDVQYAMDQIIKISAKIMIQKQIKQKPFHGRSTAFLESLEICLSSEVGTDYFYRYLENNYCAELVVYLKLMQKFKNQRSDKERYIVAKDIIKNCIVCDGDFAINISYETRKNILDDFNKLEEEWLSINIPINYFNDVQIEMRRLIVKNYWFKFVASIGNLRNSCSIDVNTLSFE